MLPTGNYLMAKGRVQCTLYSTLLREYLQYPCLVLDGQTLNLVLYLVFHEGQLLARFIYIVSRDQYFNDHNLDSACEISFCMVPSL